MAATRNQNRTVSRSPELGASQDLPAQDEQETIQLSEANLSHRCSIWINNLPKELIMVKTYSDVLVLWQHTNDKLGEPTRWVLCALRFDKPPLMNKIERDTRHIEFWFDMATHTSSRITHTVRPQASLSQEGAGFDTEQKRAVLKICHGYAV